MNPIVLMKPISVNYIAPIFAIACIGFFVANCQAQDRRFASSSRLSLGTQMNLSASVRAGDIDADGDVDLVVANGRHWPQQNLLFLNQGAARFNVLRPLGTDSRTSYACELADLDGDGDLDLVFADDDDGDTVWLNDGAGTFTDTGQSLGLANSHAVKLGDLDGDGDWDMVLGDHVGSNSMWLNDGSGTFTFSQNLGTTDGEMVVLADLDGNGTLDAAFANDAQANRVWFNS